METSTSTRAVAGAEAQLIVATADIQYLRTRCFGVPLTELILLLQLDFCVSAFSNETENRDTAMYV